MASLTMPQLHLGRGTHRAGITVFPVWTSATPIRGLATGAAAAVEVGEMPDGPAVPWLELSNTGSRPALMLEGELLEGGWQSRALVRDVILEPQHRRRVEVACVEQGRWGGGGGHQRRLRRATPRVQRALRSSDHSSADHQRQSRVWSEVERYQALVPTATSSLVEQLTVLDSDCGTAEPPLRTLTGQTGVLVALGGQPLGLELFGSPAALTEHLPAILQAARMDAMMSLGGHAGGLLAEPAPVRRARRMAARLELIDIFTGHEDAGAGHSLIAETPKLWLRGVATADGRIAHLSAQNITHPLLEMTA